MLIKAGVDISRLKREIRRALNLVQSVLLDYDLEPIITSTYEGNHSAGSLHYSNDAFDIRKPPTNLIEITNKLQRELSNHYDVINEGNHIHIEYDP